MQPFTLHPEDTQHQSRAQDTRKYRAMLRAQDARKHLAARAESEIAGLLKSLGVASQPGEYNDSHDLTLSDGRRVEVKAARYSKGGRGYLANMRGNVADYLVLVCYLPDGDTARFVIPWYEVQGLTVIRVYGKDPILYAGRWSRYLDRFDLITSEVKQ